MRPVLVAEFTRRLRKARRRLFLTVARTDEELATLAAGAFGVCDTCGQPIPLTRLRAMPTARYCVPCQVKRGT